MKAKTPNVITPFEDSNNLKALSIKHKKDAQFYLEKAKSQEAEKKQQGFHFVPINPRTFVMRKTN